MENNKLITFEEYFEKMGVQPNFSIGSCYTVFINNIKNSINADDIYKYAAIYTMQIFALNGEKNFKECCNSVISRMLCDANINADENKLKDTVNDLIMKLSSVVLRNVIHNVETQQQEQPQQPAVVTTEAQAANYSVGDIVNKFIPVQSSAPQTVELTDAQKAEFIMHSDVFKNSVKLDSKINAEVSPQQVLNIWEIIHSDAFKNYLYAKGIPINVSYKQVVNDHEDPNLNMKFEIIGSNGNVLYIGDERRYIII